MTPREKVQKFIDTMQGLESALQGYVAHLEGHAQAMVRGAEASDAVLAGNARITRQMGNIGKRNLERFLKQGGKIPGDPP